MTAPGAGRRRALRRGARAEAAAALWLRLKGYGIVARRFACRTGEIDLIARRGDVLAFVEVKSRDDAAEAAAAITAGKRARIVSAARSWLAAHPDDARCACRFDAILVRPWRPPVHIEDAWRV
jgi:putative endonuclease